MRPSIADKRRWRLVAYAAAVLVLLPLVVLVLSWNSLDVDIWTHLLHHDPGSDTDNEY
ncbi:MAG: hypothetical protein WBA27_16125 [Pseudomonas neustonica]